jgi:hypothetical protein
VIYQTKEPNIIRSCVLNAKCENVRYYLFLIWPICHIYGIYYIYYILINKYNIRYYSYCNFY